MAENGIGTWIKKTVKLKMSCYEKIICSVCGRTPCANFQEEYWLTDFCPHCGAKMSNEFDEEGNMIPEVFLKSKRLE